MTKEDIDVYEFHEAFAGQILAVLNALQSESFCKNYMGRSEAVSLGILVFSLAFGDLCEFEQYTFAFTGAIKRMINRNRFINCEICF